MDAKEQLKAEISQLSFEQAMAELDKLVRNLESGQVPLEELIQGFEKGNMLAAYCRGKLEKLEKRIELLTRDDGGNGEWTDFNPDATTSRKIADTAEAKAKPKAVDTDSDLPF